MENYLNYAPCLYFSSKDDGTIIDVNNTLCRQLGFLKEELIGNKLETIFTIATRIFQQTHFFPLLKMHEHAEEIFITLLTKDKDHVPVLINAERKIINNDVVNIHVGIVVHNRKKFEEELITAKKTAEKALNENTTLLQAKKELQQHAEQLDYQINIVNKQNAELRQFNRVVTHDLQEPLRKFSVFSQLLFEEKDEVKQKSIVEKLIRVTDKMRSIISGLQQYVWLTEAGLVNAEVELNKVWLIAKQELTSEYPNIDIEVEAEELPTIIADWGQIKMLFYQIFSNAIRFKKADEKVRIKITADSLKINSFKSIKNKYKYSNYLKLKIHDNGIGFEAEYKEQVFELFKRLHHESGRGIGLSLCKKIIENHHGSISIDSKKGEGSTVTILLPLVYQSVPDKIEV